MKDFLEFSHHGPHSPSFEIFTIDCGVWILVALVGLGCLAFVAFARGEEVSALWIVIASLCVFALAWRFHSAWLMAKVLTISDSRVTPAVRCEDGKDFVPSNKWVVFGHHFAAIAGPGPLVGPVLAAQFGFLPGTLWILIGATLGGMAGSIGGMLIALAVGEILQKTGSYALIFVVSASSYLVALLVIQLLAPRLDPVRL